MKINIVTKGKFKDNSYIYQIAVEIEVEKIPSKWVVSIEKYLSLLKVTFTTLSTIEIIPPYSQWLFLKVHFSINTLLQPISIADPVVPNAFEKSRFEITIPSAHGFNVINDICRCASKFALVVEDIWNGL